MRLSANVDMGISMMVILVAECIPPAQSIVSVFKLDRHPKHPGATGGLRSTVDIVFLRLHGCRHISFGIDDIVALGVISQHCINTQSPRPPITTKIVSLPKAQKNTR